MKIFLSLLLLTLSFLSLNAQIYLDIEVDQAKDTIEANIDNPRFTILDVRTPAEYLPEHIEGAFNRDFYDLDFELQLDSLDKSRTFLIYCRSGNRSGQTITMMEELGFERVYNILGGMNDWNANGFPVTDVIPEFVNIYSFSTGLQSLYSSSIQVFPNPVNNYLNLEFLEDDVSTINFKIVQLNGVNALNGVVNNSLKKIDLSLLNTGVYNLLLFKEEQLIHSTNIIKN